MKKLISRLGLIGCGLFISISVNALPVDEHGRTLLNHEAQGGHTIRRHVSKSLTWLRNRCRTDRSVKRSYATSYYYRGEAEDIIADMIKDNRSKVNVFINGFKKRETLLEKESWWERPWGYGHGIDCRKVGKTKKVTIRFRGRPITFSYPIDVVNTKSARTILNKSTRATGGWHILTSYPTKF